jgi:aryl-alcohol dehydrogenase-like predicted oxidoreductase
MPFFADKIALGSANFGQSYGVANSAGKLAQNDVELILKEALSCGVHCLDTAVAYGESESVLGRAGVSGWSVVTKLPPLPDEEVDPIGWVIGNARASLGRLRLKSLNGFLLHKPSDLLGANGPLLYKGLMECKETGLAARIGISIYDPEELDAIIPLYPIDIVQAPFNVLDRRIQQSGWLGKLQEMGVEMHARSTFLQGLLLMEKGERPVKYARWNDVWDAWHFWLKDTGITALEACIAFVMRCSEMKRVVLGVDSARHLREILGVTQSGILIPPSCLASNDLDLINPSRWASL